MKFLLVNDRINANRVEDDVLGVDVEDLVGVVEVMENGDVMPSTKLICSTNVKLPKKRLNDDVVEEMQVREQLINVKGVVEENVFVDLAKEQEKTTIEEVCSPMLETVMKRWLGFERSNTGVIKRIEKCGASPLGKRSSVRLTTPKPVLRLTKKNDGGSSKKKKIVPKNKVKDMIEKYEQDRTEEKVLKQDSSKTSKTAGVAHQGEEVCTPELTSIRLSSFLLGEGKPRNNNIARPFWIKKNSEELGNLGNAEVKDIKGAKGPEGVPNKGIKGGRGGRGQLGQ